MARRRRPPAGLGACLLFARTEISLDPIAIRIDDERRIVIVAVDRPQTARAIVAPTGVECGRMKVIDRTEARGGKANMQARPVVRRDRTLGRHDPEKNNVGSVTIAGAGPRSPDASVADRSQRLGIN